MNVSAFFVRQLAALADATDEHMAIVRAADSEDLDAVQFKETCSAFLMHIHYLFHKARLWTTPHTYAAAMLHPDCVMWHVFYNSQIRTLSLEDVAEERAAAHQCGWPPQAVRR